MAGASVSTDLTMLQSRVSALADRQQFAVHWEIRALELPAGRLGEVDAIGQGVVGGDIIGQGPQRQLAAFSTRKVSLLLACLALVHRGELNLEQRLAVTEEMKEGVQAGIMKNMAPGVELSLQDHLRQMMITSDNICTQLVFEAIGQTTGDALQWVNDYCSWVGMRETLHREIFPRSGDLDWHHGIEHMTVTTPADQAQLLHLLGRGMHDADAAAALHLTPQLCRFAVELMRGIYTPLLGAGATELRFAEKNGRGLRGLSQVGLATTSEGEAVAAVAVFAENIPAQLPDGRPGRLAAYELFAAVGQAVEDWYRGEGPALSLSRNVHPDPEQASRPGDAASPAGSHTRRPHTAPIAPQSPAAWATKTFTGGETTHQASSGTTAPHALAGAGKLFAALALAERAEREPSLLQMQVAITGTHRRQAAVGPLRTHTGDLTLALGDALGLIIGTSDAATSLAVRDALEEQRIDLVEETQSLLTQLDAGGAALGQTSITGLEDPGHAAGDLLVGETTPEDLTHLLSLLARAGGLQGRQQGEQQADRAQDQARREVSAAAAERVLGWMSQVFEPAGLTYALPGYGPKKVPQWSVSGLELRSPSPSSTSSEPQGWTSVMIAHTAQTQTHAAQAQEGLVVMAAHHPPHADPMAVSGRPLSQTSLSQTFGTLGSAAYRGAEIP